MLLKTRKLFSEFHSQPTKKKYIYQFQYSHIPSSVSIYLQKNKMSSIENLKIFYAEIKGA